MAGTLKKSIFLNFQKKFKEKCITLFVEAYNASISSKAVSLDFHENDITAILHNYINENPKRLKWSISTNPESHIFNKSVDYTKGFAAKFARIDMRFVNIWQGVEHKYFMEAKNLKSNDSSSKRRYIETGIDNFLTTGNYYNCDGFLVGYILEGTVENCVKGINKLLEKDKRQNEKIEKTSTFLSIDNHFSKHQEKEMYHLFLNYVN
ncbi:conserved hypothetical protein [Flavobacterium psychrophilum]|uniref:hypothetical protein n=1 Tax=Flavobacterium psychrophilum TaxID=96345 RepID=UPI000B7C0E8A|nr:hypothetical protein [Flavobacterium psychrophilum]SNB31291.1 conserved hypothetical protein [Flavobacterium psychrophilum]